MKTVEMTSVDVAHQRLRNQQLSATHFSKPQNLVKWMAAVQAQDYMGAKWAVGQRVLGATDDTIEKMFADGKILRTHVLRPTWHFVSPADIRWMLKLTGPRVNLANSHYHRKLELDDAIFRRSNQVLVSALKGGKNLTRDVLRKVLDGAGIPTNELRLVHLLCRAEIDGVICSGPRSGKRFTHALLEERVPPRKDLARDEALATLTRRYFRSRGPATLQDFVWWSGLTIGDARIGIEMIQRGLEQEVIEGRTHWLLPAKPAAKGPSYVPAAISIGAVRSQVACLLPTYDEYLIAYKDRSAALEPIDGNQRALGNAVFISPILIRGCVAGRWTRTFKGNSVAVTLSPFAPLTRAERKAVYEAAHRYGLFSGKSVLLE